MVQAREERRAREGEEVLCIDGLLDLGGGGYVGEGVALVGVAVDDEGDVVEVWELEGCPRLVRTTLILRISQIHVWAGGRTVRGDGVDRLARNACHTERRESGDESNTRELHL